jgi:hypothetical protein
MPFLKNLTLHLIDTYTKLSGGKFMYIFQMKDFGKILTKDSEQVGLWFFKKRMLF